MNRASDDERYTPIHQAAWYGGWGGGRGEKREREEEGKGREGGGKRKRRQDSFWSFNPLLNAHLTTPPQPHPQPKKRYGASIPLMARLLRFGADPNLKTSKGENAREIAMRKHPQDTELAEFLGFVSKLSVFPTVSQVREREKGERGKEEEGKREGKGGNARDLASRKHPRYKSGRDFGFYSKVSIFPTMSQGRESEREGERGKERRKRGKCKKYSE